MLSRILTIANPVVFCEVPVNCWIRRNCRSNARKNSFSSLVARMPCHDAENYLTGKKLLQPVFSAYQLASRRVYAADGNEVEPLYSRISQREFEAHQLIFVVPSTAGEKDFLWNEFQLCHAGYRFATLLKFHFLHCSIPLEPFIKFYPEHIIHVHQHGIYFLPHSLVAKT